MRHHLALAYEANEERDQAIEALEQAVEELEVLRGGGEGGGARPEPVWAEDIRSQLARLREQS